MLKRNLPPIEYHTIVDDPIKRRVVDNLIIMMAADPESLSPHKLIYHAFKAIHPTSKAKYHEWSLGMIADVTDKYLERRVRDSK